MADSAPGPIPPNVFEDRTRIPWSRRTSAVVSEMSGDPRQVARSPVSPAAAHGSASDRWDTGQQESKISCQNGHLTLAAKKKEKQKMKLLMAKFFGVEKETKRGER
ncbi:hypothetical protein GN956_G18709 [Arapaima gigas]